MNREEVLIVQRKMLSLGYLHSVDGIWGGGSERALKLLERDFGISVDRTFLGILGAVSGKVITPKNPRNNLKDTVMDYLERWEGSHLHKGKNEGEVTSAYGIHKRSFPSSAIFKFYLFLCASHGLKANLNDLNVRMSLNDIISTDVELKRKERDICWVFYEENFINKHVRDVIASQKINLTHLSLSINGGKSRGNKALQTAINKKSVIIDGIIGRGTINALVSIVESNFIEDDFNLSMLRYMRRHYARLIRNNPVEYGINKVGWENRMRVLE